MDIAIEDRDSTKFGREFLSPVLEWINANMAVDDVFSKTNIELWLSIAGYDRVTDKKLAEWAEANGYIHRSQIR